jgi:NAD+ diphosphatase
MSQFCPTCGARLIDRQFEARARKACPDATCGYVAWRNPTPVVGALIEYDGAMLLARGAGWPPDWFALITGYLEENEDPLAGLAREIHEEIGLRLLSAHQIGNYIFTRKNELMLCYHVVCDGTLRLNHEIAEVRRYRPEELRPWPGATGQAVADWLRARGLPVIPAVRTSRVSKPAEKSD